MTGLSAIGGEAVSRSPYGFNGAATEGVIDLLAQVADVDLDNVGIAAEVGVSYVLGDGRLGDRGGK
jgi:hypothetical protein